MSEYLLSLLESAALHAVPLPDLFKCLLINSDNQFVLETSTPPFSKLTSALRQHPSLNNFIKEKQINPLPDKLLLPARLVLKLTQPFCDCQLELPSPLAARISAFVECFRNHQLPDEDFPSLLELKHKLEPLPPWRQLKRHYLLQILSSLLQSSASLPEILLSFRLQLHPNGAHAIEIHPDKRLVAELKRRGLYEQPKRIVQLLSDKQIIAKFAALMEADRNSWPTLKQLLQEQEVQGLFAELQALRQKDLPDVQHLLSLREKVLKPKPQAQNALQKHCLRQVTTMLGNLYLDSALQQQVVVVQILPYLRLKLSRKRQCGKVTLDFDQRYFQIFMYNDSFRELNEQLDAYSYVKKLWGSAMNFPGYEELLKLKIEEYKPAPFEANIRGMLEMIVNNRSQVEQYIGMYTNSNQGKAIYANLGQILAAGSNSQEVVGICNLLRQLKPQSVAPAPQGEQAVRKQRKMQFMFNIEEKQRAIQNGRRLLKELQLRDILLPELLLFIHVFKNDNNVSYLRLNMSNEFFAFLENNDTITGLIKDLHSEGIFQEQSSSFPITSFSVCEKRGVLINEQECLVDRICSFNQNRAKLRERLQRVLEDPKVRALISELQALSEQGYSNLACKAYEVLSSISEFVKQAPGQIARRGVE